MNGSVGRVARSEVGAACAALVSHYPVHGWWPARSRFEVMVGAVLVQNTRWTNVEAAIRGLRRAGYLKPAAISASKPAYLMGLIQPAGCQSVKARRLQALATWVETSGGLRRLAATATEPLRNQLLAVHGVGPETADAILCFAFKRRVFIADSYSRRWLRRLRLLPDEPLADYETCRNLVERMLSDSAMDYRDLHAAIILHGQSVCGPTPKCEACLIRGACRRDH